MVGKITELNELISADAAPTDLVEVVDVSDASMAASGTNKKMQLSHLLQIVSAGSAAPITRGALNDLANSLGLTTGKMYLVTDETPDKFVVATSDTEYINLLPVSTYRPPASIGDLRTIAEENAFDGYPTASWQISGIGDTGALGYATSMSVRAGDTIEFKVHSGNLGYSIDIVRLGYYGGDGARLVDTLANGGTSQPNGNLRSTGEGGVGSRDCSNWTVTDSWNVPIDATNGVYLGVIKRAGRSTFAHIGPFIVDNERGDSADVVCLLSDMTWRAYNAFGTISDPTSGKSLYGVGVGNFSQGGRAWDVSYDTPLVINGGVSQTSYWNGERPIHYWLEQNGYDVHYVSMFDVDRDPGLLLSHNTVMMCGHNEYISQGVRDAWDGAIASGIHAIVMSGNTMLWRTRMVGRVMVCHKDSHTQDGVGTGVDPVSWTGTWRDTRWEDRRPECESIGMMFVANGIRNDAISIPASFAAEPMWRDTSINGLVDPERETLKSGSLGFEWDTFEPTYGASMRYPPGIKFLSHSPANLTGGSANEDGSIYNATINPCIHRIVAYKVGAALVVNFGTNQWGWGLSEAHVRGDASINLTMRQATVNLLADMSCQPETIEPDLTAATNQLSSWVFPTMTSLSIPDAASVSKDSTTILRATAIWSNGISTDFANYVVWTSSDEAVATVKEGGVVAGITQGTATITGTYGTTTDTCALTVGPRVVPRDTFLAQNYTYSGQIFSDGAITLGTQFRKKATGSVFVAGVRYWRSTNVQSQPPVGYCARVGGTVLASKVSTFPTPSSAGWEYLIFDTPVEITSPDNHIVWVWLPSGGYGSVPGYFTNPARLSQLGLFDSTSVSGAGKYRQPPAGTPDTTQPAASFNNNFYLVEPLVTAEIVIPEPGDPTALNIAPASVTMSVGSTQQLVGEVSWENIAPTNETAFTDWVSNAPSIATVSSGGIVTAVSVGSATITGTYEHPVDTFVDTCPVTVAAVAHGWAGANPTAQADLNSYELGTWFTVTEATTIIAIRIWNPGLVAPGAGQARVARLWTHNGSGGLAAQQRQVALPSVMPVGWSEYTIANFSATTSGFYCVSYFVDAPSGVITASDYGAVVNAFASPVAGRITFPAGAGRYVSTPSPGTFPTSLSVTTNPFYGVDVVYADD